jgi:hypothetical protein
MRMRLIEKIDNAMTGSKETVKAEQKRLSVPRPKPCTTFSHAPLNLYIFDSPPSKFHQNSTQWLLHILSSKVVFRRLIKLYTRVKILTEQKLRASFVFHVINFALNKEIISSKQQYEKCITEL